MREIAVELIAKNHLKEAFLWALAEMRQKAQRNVNASIVIIATKLSKPINWDPSHQDGLSGVKPSFPREDGMR